jgi:hypothetical protein
MKPSHFAIVACVVVGVVGCPTRDKYDRMPTVSITAPLGETYTNGIVRITVNPSLDVDLPIVLRRGDGVDIESLTPPTRSYDWNTTVVPEGSYTVTAEMRFARFVSRSAPVTIVVDRTKPTVTLTPPPGAVDVAFRSPILAAFSEPIVLSQSTATTFPVSISGTQAASTTVVNAQATNATVTIDDPASVVLPAQFSIDLAPSITDRAGNALVLSTSAWSWDVPAWFRAPTMSTVTAPAIAIGADGNPFLVRTEGNPGPSSLHVSKYNGTTWSELGSIAGMVSQPSFDSYSLTLDDMGNPALAYVESNIGASVIRVRRWDGAAWQPALPDLDWDGQSNVTRARFPIVRLTPNGTPVVAWREYLGSGADEDIFVARWDGNQWDKSFGGSGLRTVNGHALALDTAGNPLLAWSTTGGCGLTIWSGATKTTSPMLFESGMPSVTVDLAGRPVFLSGAGPTFGLYVLEQGAWHSAFGPVPTSSFARLPRLALGPDGQPVVGWVDSAGPIRIGVAKWTGNKWDTRFGLFYDGSTVASESPEVAVDGNGSIWVAWRDDVKVNVWKSNY